MSAATADRDSKKKPGKLVSYLMGAVHLYKGTLAFVQAADGYLYAARTTNTITDVFAGVNYQNVDNSAGSAGAASMLIDKEGDHSFVASGATQTWVGLPAYALDNQTVAITTATTRIWVGEIVEYISSTEVRVRIDNAVGTSQTTAP